MSITNKKVDKWNFYKFLLSSNGLPPPTERYNKLFESTLDILIANTLKEVSKRKFALNVPKARVQAVKKAEILSDHNDNWIIFKKLFAELNNGKLPPLKTWPIGKEALLNKIRDIRVVKLDIEQQRNSRLGSISIEEIPNELIKALKSGKFKFKDLNASTKTLVPSIVSALSTAASQNQAISTDNTVTLSVTFILKHASEIDNDSDRRRVRTINVTLFPGDILNDVVQTAVQLEVQQFADSIDQSTDEWRVFLNGEFLNLTSIIPLGPNSKGIRNMTDVRERFSRRRVTNLTVNYYNGLVINFQNKDGSNCAIEALRSKVKDLKLTDINTILNEDGSVTVGVLFDYLTKNNIRTRILDGWCNVILSNTEYVLSKRNFSFCVASGHCYPLSQEAMLKLRRIKEKDLKIINNMFKIEMRKTKFKDIEWENRINIDGPEFATLDKPGFHEYGINESNLDGVVKHFYLNNNKTVPEVVCSNGLIKIVTYIFTVSGTVGMVKFVRNTRHCRISKTFNDFLKGAEEDTLNNGRYSSSLLIKSIVPNDKLHCFPYHTLAQKKFEEIGDNAISLDLVCAHGSQLANPVKFGWPKYIGNELFEPFDGEVKCGRYLIKFDHVPLPYAGTHWYSDDFAYWGIQNGLIKPSQIILQYVCAGSVEPDYFKHQMQLIYDDLHEARQYKKIEENKKKLNPETFTRDKLDEYIETEAYCKQKIVTFCGLLGKTDYTKCDSLFTNLAEDLAYYSSYRHEGYQVSAQTIIDDLILVNKTVRCSHNESYLPVYAKIRDLENIRLFQLLQKTGGTCAYVQCDTIVVNNPSVEFITNPQTEEKLGGWRIQEIKQYQRDTPITDFQAWCKARSKDSDVADTWKHTLEEHDPEYPETLEFIKNNNCLISAEAGNGKSELVKKLKLAFPDPKRIMCCSFTGVASRLIGGQTLHSLFGVSPFDPEFIGQMSKLKNIDVLILDECFMAPPRFCKFLMKASYSGMRIICLGDPAQMGSPDNEFNRLTIDNFVNLCNGNHHILMYPHRHKGDYTVSTTIKKAIKQGKLPKLEMVTNKNAPLRGLCYYNKTRLKINRESSLKYLINNPFLVTSDFIFDVEKELEGAYYSYTICAGMPIICYKNKPVKRGNYTSSMNGERAIINQINIKANRIGVIYPDGMQEQLSFRDFTTYWCLDYGISIYKAQGQSFKDKYFITDIYAIKNIEGGIYTALTRATKLENISVMVRIKPIIPVITQPVDEQYDADLNMEAALYSIIN